MPIIAPISPEQISRVAGRVWAAVRRRQQPDHRAISERQYGITPGVMPRFYFYGAVAPGWWSPREADEGQVGRAGAFADMLLSNLFSGAPAVAEASGTTFRRTNPDDNMDDVALRIRPTGLIEFSWALVPELDRQNRLVLSACDIAWLAGRPGWAVQQNAYAELSRLGSRRRRMRQLDWCFSVNPAVATASGQRYWEALRFVVDEPPRATHTWATVPPAGYGGGLHRAAGAPSSDEVARVVLTEHLQANGYHDYRAAVEATVDAIRSRSQPPSYAGPLHGG